MEIIGNGMMAKGFLPYSTDINRVVVFATGVSDSTLTDWQEYDRECQTLYQVVRDCKETDKRLVYFSSGGTVYGRCDEERKEESPLFPETMYGRHKVLCEAVIISSGVRYLIARLPTVVGQTKSKKQLIPVLIKQAMEGHVTLFKDAQRDIISIADVARIITVILKALKRDEIINVASGISVSVSDILNEIQNNLGVSPIVRIVSGGDKQRFSIARLRTYCPEIIFTKEYYRSVIQNYISESHYNA